MGRGSVAADGDGLRFLASGSKVRTLYASVRQQHLALAGEHDAAGLEDVSAVAQLERLHDALLDQQDGQPALAPDAIDGLEDLLDDARAQALGGLVEQEQVGPGHEPAPQREHLLLAAGQRAGELSVTLPKNREQREHLVQRALAAGARRAAIRSELEILHHRQRREDATAL